MVPEDGVTDDLNCRQASKLISLAQERPLADDERAALKHHLDECLMCTTFEEQLLFLRRAMERFRAG